MTWLKIEVSCVSLFSENKIVESLLSQLEFSIVLISVRKQDSIIIIVRVRILTCINVRKERKKESLLSEVEFSPVLMSEKKERKNHYYQK